MSIKILSPIEMGEGANLIRDTKTGFPSNPKLGTDTMVDGVLYYYSSTDGAEPIWVPVGTKRLNNTITIPEPQLEWIVTHSLGTFDIMAAVYDSNNKLVQAPYTIISADVIKYTFTNPMSGKAVVFGASQKYAGFTPSVSAVNSETVSVGTGEPDESTTSTLYIQVDSATA